MQVFVLGATGLVGGHVYQKSLAKGWQVASVTRRPLTEGKNIVEADLSKWPAVIETEAKGYDAFITAFGTTRAKAGGMDEFRRIDHGTNYEAAKAAKAAGVNTFVLVSLAGALQGSFFPYMDSKGKLENDIIALEFPKTVILRPGALVGDRKESHGWANDLAMRMGAWTHNTPLNFLTYGIPAADVATVAVYEAANAKNGVTIIGPGDLIKKANELNKQTLS